ncbi:MAG: ATP-binding protein [Candidatus Saganbacteria bacterium]|nr:ATP-binding protein [Candidatus Saganbacteria bacterium]
MIKLIVFISQISPVIASVICIMLGLSVYLYNSRLKRNRLFLIFSLILSIWAFSCFMQSYTHSFMLAQYYDIVLYCAAVFAPTIFFHLSGEFTKIKRKGLTIICYLASITLFFMNFSPVFRFGVVYLQGNRFVTVPSIGWYIYLVFFTSIVGVALYDLYDLIRRSFGQIKLQAYYLLISFGFLIIGGSSYFALIMFKIRYPADAIFNLISSTALSFYEITIAYAITRYRLMEIEVIIRKTLLYSSLTAVISAVYFSLIYISDFFFKTLTGYNFMWVTIPSLFVLAIFFQPLKNYLQQRIDKTFFKTRYEADKIRVKFSDGINKLMKVEDLAEYINRAAYKIFKLSGCATYIFDEDQRKYICYDARGTMAEQKTKTFSDNDPLILEIKKSRKVVLRDEQKAMMQQEGNNTSRVLYEEMKNMNARICVSSLSRKKDYRLIAFLIADEKKSQDQFTSEDILLLETIASQAVLNIENAVLYQAMIEAKKRKLQIERLSDLGAAAANVAREARAALAPIISFSRQFARRWDDPGFLNNAQEYLPFEVERLRLILTGILEYSREFKYGLERINLKDTVGSMLGIIKFEARNKNITLEEDINDDIEINADKDRIRHVMLNLFINSMEAMPYGGKISVSGKKEEGKVVVRVSDTGSGIHHNTIDKIFDPFYTTKKNAIGLGLAIVRKVIEGHGGAVRAESRSGQGTDIIITLPQ